MKRTETHQQRLRRHALFSRLTDDQLRVVLEAGDFETYERGEKIVSEGSLGDSVYLLVRGRGLVCKGEALDRPLAELRAGEFFGEMSLVEAAPRSASVIASDSVTVFRLPNRALRGLADTDPKAMNGVLVAVIRVLSERLRHMNDNFADIGKLSDWLSRSLV